MKLKIAGFSKGKDVLVVEDFDNNGAITDLKTTRGGEILKGYEVDISKLPKHVTVLRFLSIEPE